MLEPVPKARRTGTFVAILCRDPLSNRPFFDKVCDKGPESERLGQALC